MEQDDGKMIWLERIIGNFGERGSARALFGDPVERGGVTVIPVAKVRMGMGGGMGEGDSGGGRGGGGGVMGKPVGFIELKDGHARFRPIFSILNLVPLLMASAVAFALSTRSLRRARA